MHVHARAHVGSVFPMSTHNPYGRRRGQARELVGIQGKVTPAFRTKVNERAAQLGMSTSLYLEVLLEAEIKNHYLGEVPLDSGVLDGL